MTSHDNPAPPNPVIIRFLQGWWRDILHSLADLAPLDLALDPAAIATSQAYREWELIVNREGKAKRLEDMCEKWGRLLFAPYKGGNTYRVPQWWEATEIGKAWHVCRMQAVAAQGITLYSTLQAAEQLGVRRASVEHHIQRGELVPYVDVDAPPRQRRRLIRADQLRRLEKTKQAKRKTKVAHEQ